MAKSKHKRRGQRKQKISKKQLRKKRQKAAKIKDKVQRHRKKNKQNKSSKGFFAIIGSYLENKLRDIEKNFQGSAFSKKANSIYSTADLIKAIVSLMILGISRVYHVNKYQEETKLAKVIGLSKFPSATTVYRFLNKFSTLTFCRRVRRTNRDLIQSNLSKQKEIVVDGDTSTIQSHINQKEGACKGFNKKKPGSRCFQAIEFFAGGFSIKSDILAGNKAPVKSHVTLNHLKEVRKLCGRIDWVRLDAGFVGSKMLCLLEDFSVVGNSKNKVKYVVNAGMQCIGAIEAKRTSCSRQWHKIEKHVYAQDHGFCKVYKDDEKLRRLVLVKKFFPGGQKKGSWQFSLLCTNDSMPMINLYYFYHQRQTIENFFDEAKNDFSLEHLPCSKLLGNSLYFTIIGLAFNILHLFRKDILRKEDQHFRLSTLQMKYLQLQIGFDGSTLFIYRFISFYYRRLLVILQRLKKLGITLEYQIC